MQDLIDKLKEARAIARQYIKDTPSENPLDNLEMLAANQVIKDLTHMIDVVCDVGDVPGDIFLQGADDIPGLTDAIGDIFREAGFKGGRLHGG